MAGILFMTSEQGMTFRWAVADKTNVAWVTHQQHAELIVWWNDQYKRAAAAK